MTAKLLLGETLYGQFSKKNNKKTLSLDEIYAEIDGHEKCKHNPNWKAKVRQILQYMPQCVNVSKGIWAVA